MPAVDTRAELRRVLAVVEGPLRFAQKTDQTLAALRDFGAIVARAAVGANQLPLSMGQRQALERIVTAASTFDNEGIADRRRLLAAIAAEIQGLDQEAVPEAATPKRKRALNPEAPHAPTDLEGDRLTRPLTSLKGVGPAIAQRLAARSLFTIGELLLFLPRTYEDRRRDSKIAELREGQHTLIKARIVAFNERFAGRKTYELELEDGTGTLTARWFSFRPGAYRRFAPGVAVTVSGQTRIGVRGRLEMVHPDLEIGEETQDDSSFGRIIPVYSQIEGLSARALRRLTQRVVADCSSDVVDFLPDSFRAKHDLPTLSSALAAVHFPPEEASIDDLVQFRSPPQRRLVFDELFLVQVGLALKRRGVQVEPGIPFKADSAIVDRALERLPFKLTNAQRRSVDEIVRDISRPVPMHRLLQGDVGSGKTAVALASALIAVENGYQAAVMAPTELLAEQHLRTFETILGNGLFGARDGKSPVRMGILASGRNAKELQRTRNELASGTLNIVVGTHALIQERVEFHKLALVVVDEQHRFGVVQRAQLMQKGLSPHVLVMTATPIPRTLALTLYGDLDVSIIDELPPGRTPVTTRVYPGRSRARVYELVRKEVSQGRQAYVVLPLVEESDKLDLRAATEEAERLQKEDLAGLSVGLVHGRLSTEERSARMQSFRRGETQVLVATTVIEVGVDVPNASVMVIEHAERFGLSQLHQLRGRVGRGAAQSFCLLVSEENRASTEAQERLAIVARTSNGFQLAEADLELRGPGEFLGTKQSGLPDLVVANLLRDQLVLKEAREAAFALIERDPDLRDPLHQGIATELKRRWAGKLSLARIG